MLKQSWLMAGLLVLMTPLVHAQNYNNGEDLAKFVTSDAFKHMSASELKPIRNQVSQHLQKCVAATVSDLRKHPKPIGVSAAQLQRHYQLWLPYYRSVCDLYASDEYKDATHLDTQKLRCEVFSQSTFYSEVLGYQNQALPACQSPAQ